VAVVVVLALLAITLALSYSVIRSQVTAVQLSQNWQRYGDARHVARAGIHAALRSMSAANWAGVTVPLNGSPSSSESYTVSYQTGDSTLTAASADYVEYPYRVTITSLGTTVDPLHPSQQSTYRIRIVARLVPRQLAPAPAGWSTVAPYTAYQWQNRSVTIELPARIEGPFRFQGALELCGDYPSGSSRSQYLADLNRMRLVGRPDQRPFSGPLSFPFSRTGDRSVLQTELALQIQDVPSDRSMPFSGPGCINAYRLYPGGMTYQPQSINASLSNQTLGPDPLSNPLGIYQRNGRVELGDNVTIQGFVVAWGSGGLKDVHVVGANVNLQGVTLPAVVGDSNTYRLPAVAAADDVRVYAGPCSIRGTVYAEDVFSVPQTYGYIRSHILGKLVCGELKLLGNVPWDNLDWTTALSQFQQQSQVTFYPDWLQQKRFISPEPVVTVNSDAAGVVQHWPDWTQPIFVPHPSDGGLRWEVVTWQEGV
jgi:hypothetical protein